MSLALLILLWLHVKTAKGIALACVAIATILWSSQKLLWFMLLLRRNMGVGVNEVDIIPLQENSEQLVTAVEVIIKVKKHWRGKPGQYVYLTLPHHAGFGIGLLQAHPYCVVWVENQFSTGTQSITLLVEIQRGFSDTLRFGRHLKQHAVLDGPYGVTRDLRHFDKVLFLASGVGIAAHLAYIRQLLEAHTRRDARVRRLSLVWIVESKGNSCCDRHFLPCQLIIVRTRSLGPRISRSFDRA